MHADAFCSQEWRLAGHNGHFRTIRSLLPKTVQGNERKYRPHSTSGQSRSQNQVENRYSYWQTVSPVILVPCESRSDVWSGRSESRKRTSSTARPSPGPHHSMAQQPMPLPPLPDRTFVWPSSSGRMPPPTPQSALPQFLPPPYQGRDDGIFSTSLRDWSQIYTRECRRFLLVVNRMIQGQNADLDI